jgi:hypothetical protein
MQDGGRGHDVAAVPGRGLQQGHLPPVPPLIRSAEGLGHRQVVEPVGRVVLLAQVRTERGVRQLLVFP